MCSVTGGAVEQKVRADLKSVYIPAMAFNGTILQLREPLKIKKLYKCTNDFTTLIMQLLRKYPYEPLRKTKDIVIKKTL